MSLPVFQATIVNDSGDIIPSAVVTVLDEITGLGLTVYSNRAGTVPLGTNGVFTAGTDGFAQFFAPAGNYRVKAEQAASGFEKTWDFVPLVGGSAFDVDSYTAFGLGGSYISAETDLDDYPVGSLGVTTPASGMVNGPAGAVYRATVDTLGNESGLFVTQKLVDDTGAIFERNKRITTWSDWKPVYTGANLVEAQNVSGGTVLASGQTAGANLVPAQSGNWSPATDTLDNAYNIWVKQ